MTDAATVIEIHDMRIAGITARHVVAKVQRISSPPVAADAVANPRECALFRLADVFRGGSKTRAYADFCDFKRHSQEQLSAAWDSYVSQVCKALGLERLDPLELGPLPAADICTAPTVTYHFAEMNGRDYVVARVGTILGAPAAWALLDDPAISALDRLADVFRAGEGSQCFTDFAAGRPTADVLSAWILHGAVVKAEQVTRNGLGAKRTEWIKDSAIISGELYRYYRRSPSDRLRPGVMLSEGDVVRAMVRPELAPFVGPIVQIVDRETGAELGIVPVASLRPL